MHLLPDAFKVFQASVTLKCGLVHFYMVTTHLSISVICSSVIAAGALESSCKIGARGDIALNVSMQSFCQFHACRI